MKRLRDEYSDIYDMAFVFANTGQEHEKTLQFAERCSKEWSIPIVWVEAVVHHNEKLGCTHRIVDFNTASRHGEPFEEVIKKYGIPNKSYPHCTRELKLNPIRSYMKALGWEEYLTAIGIRSDEPRRIRKDAEAAGIIYPLVSMFPTDKPAINDWWEEQPFQLDLLEHQGNCTWCWKKSLKKHVMLAQESPEIFEFPARMEATYGLSGYNEDGTKRVFFRERRSTKDIVSIAQLLNPTPYANRPDDDSGCSESCEAF